MVSNAFCKQSIGLTIMFNIYIFPTEFILRLLYRIQVNIKSILFWIKKKPKKEVIMQTLNSMEVKVKVQGNSLIEEYINKINQIQNQTYASVNRLFIT
jgi:hypothetical protein